MVRLGCIYRVKQKMNDKIIIIGIFYTLLGFKSVHWGNIDSSLVIIYDKNSIFFL